MTVWLAGALGLCASVVPCGIVCLRAQDPLDRLVALEMAAVTVSLTMVLLAEAMQRTSFLDLALTQSLLLFGGALVFARFLERWV